MLQISGNLFLALFHSIGAKQKKFVWIMQELRTRSCPVVFATFSAGSKACLYRVFQVILGIQSLCLIWRILEFEVFLCPFKVKMPIVIALHINAAY